jgi:hypothetical protein
VNSPFRKLLDQVLKLEQQMEDWRDQYDAYVEQLQVLAENALGNKEEVAKQLVVGNGHPIVNKMLYYEKQFNACQKPFIDETKKSLNSFYNLCGNFRLKSTDQVRFFWLLI